LNQISNQINRIYRLTCSTTVTVSTVDGLSRLTMTSNEWAWLIRKFSHRPITFESNCNGRFESESNLEASQVSTFERCSYKRL